MIHEHILKFVNYIHKFMIYKLLFWSERIHKSEIRFVQKDQSTSVVWSTMHVETLE